MATEIMVTLGVFDDGDRIPTVVFGCIYPNTQQDTDALLTEMVEALILAARDEYGSKFPASACFWSAQTREAHHADSN
jgi:hypothetical protein